MSSFFTSLECQAGSFCVFFFFFFFNLEFRRKVQVSIQLGSISL